MDTSIEPIRFTPEQWHRKNGGPRYVQLYSHIARSITSGALPQGTQLPPEREMAELGKVSRVTVRKAIAYLVADGLIEKRQGAGSFVRAPGPKLEHSLSKLTSFTEYMQQRGKISSSRMIENGLFPPSPDEVVALEISLHDRVARILRLRSADGTVMALERSSLPSDILPDPSSITTSLYSVLRARNQAPIRAVQRISAINLGPDEARLLNLAVGAAVIQVDRTGYIKTGRPIEFTRGLYRTDIYDFISELHP